MEHELFRSELKPSVDGTLISSMIRSSSSGVHSHRAAAMELILERSIQERRERMLVKAKNSLRPDPTPQPKSGAPDIPTSQAQSSTPATASQPQSRPLSSNDAIGSATSLASVSAKCDAPQDSSALSKPTKQVKQRCEEPPADVKMDLSPPEDFVDLVCPVCNVTQLQSGLLCGSACSLCCKAWLMKCAGCGILKFTRANCCTGCHRKFK